jgi:hypothetical protein
VLSRIKLDLIVADAEMLGQGPHASGSGLGPPQLPIGDLIKRDADGGGKIAT